MQPMKPSRRLGLGVMVCASAIAQAQPTTPPASRGELLYTTHCIVCHSTQMHWREKRQATDWATLKAQVRRWQSTAQLNWSEDDITEVARYLNNTIYQFPSGERVSAAQP